MLLLVYIFVIDGLVYLFGVGGVYWVFVFEEVQVCFFEWQFVVGQQLLYFVFGVFYYLFVDYLMYVIGQYGIEVCYQLYVVCVVVGEIVQLIVEVLVVGEVLFEVGKVVGYWVLVCVDDDCVGQYQLDQFDVYKVVWYFVDEQWCGGFVVDVCVCQVMFVQFVQCIGVELC